MIKISGKTIGNVEGNLSTFNKIFFNGIQAAEIRVNNNIVGISTGENPTLDELKNHGCSNIYSVYGKYGDQVINALNGSVSAKFVSVNTGTEESPKWVNPYYNLTNIAPAKTNTQQIKFVVVSKEDTTFKSLFCSREGQQHTFSMFLTSNYSVRCDYSTAGKPYNLDIQENVLNDFSFNYLGTTFNGNFVEKVYPEDESILGNNVCLGASYEAFSSSTRSNFARGIAINSYILSDVEGDDLIYKAYLIPVKSGNDVLFVNLVNGVEYSCAGQGSVELYTNYSAVIYPFDNVEETAE